jgi:hypothetical protein
MAKSGGSTFDRRHPTKVGQNSTGVDRGGALRFGGDARGFVGIDLGREPVPDETTVCRFRHLLETHDLGRQLFDEVHRHLAAKVATGTIVDATIVNAPSCVSLDLT